MSEKNIVKTAVIEDDYRYRLTRIWKPELGLMGFIMLNPSTADAEVDDATIRKCIGFAERNGLGGIVVSNLWAFRSRDPKAMKDHIKAGRDARGPKNEGYIIQAAEQSKILVCAWGNHGSFGGRDKEVRQLLRANGHKSFSLGPLSKTGQPAHPLMLAYATKLEELG